MELTIPPPFDNDLECLVLGSILIDTECYENHFFKLSESLFYSVKNKNVFRAIVEAQNSFGKVDIVTVVKALQKQNNLSSVGGVVYITSLTSPIASTANIETHIKLLQQVDIRRKLIAFSQSLSAAAYKLDNDALDLHEKSLRQLSELADFSFESNDLIKIKDFIAMNKADFDEKLALYQQGIRTGIVTGYAGFDRKIGAFRKGNLITLAGRPGIGKTAVLIAFAIGMAKQGIPVLVYSLEMSTEEMLYRMIIHHLNGAISNESLQSGALTPKEIIDKQQAELEISKLPLTITDKPQLLSTIERKTKKWSAENRKGIVLIDYLQLIKKPKDSKKNEEQEVSELSQGLKNLAKECAIPIIQLAQLSRAVELRGGDKRPLPSDLRSSGSIEQDSDIIIMLYRDAYYDIMQDVNGESTQGIMEWIIRKNRHGALGIYKVYHSEKLSNFSEDRSTLINYATPSEYEPQSMNTLKPSVNGWDEKLEF